MRKQTLTSRMVFLDCFDQNHLRRPPNSEKLMNGNFAEPACRTSRGSRDTLVDALEIILEYPTSVSATTPGDASVLTFHIIETMSRFKSCDS